jgi:RND family efflux transporter MFP subunit
MKNLSIVSGTGRRPFLPPASTGVLLKGVALLVASFFLSASHAQTLTVEGITEPVLDVTISTPVAGIIGARLFKEGDFVRRHQTVVELDKGLEELEVKRRELVRDLTESELNRVTKLAELHTGQFFSVSAEEMEKKKAEFNISQVELELAREHLQRRLISSPLDGYISELFLEVGEACQIQQPVARIVDTRQCYFIANIDAAAGHSLKPGQSARLEIEAGGSTANFTGAISFVSPVVDPASGLMKVKVLFENPDHRIRPGVAGKAYFTLSNHVN